MTMLGKKIVVSAIVVSIVVFIVFVLLAFVAFSLVLSEPQRVLIAAAFIISSIVIMSYMTVATDKQVEEVFDTLTCARDTFMEQECTKDTK